MKAVISPNFLKPKTNSILEQSLIILKKYGIDYLVDENRDDLYEQADVIITIGGDGTIIHHAKKAAAYNKPLLGINAGRFGYLAGLEGDELELLGRLKTGEYITDSRMMLRVKLNDEVFFCLNDAVVSKGAVSRMIDIDVTVDDDMIHYRADGLIAATPTGSTAYSFSAGGPIIDPSVENIMLTPICAHSPAARSSILNAGAVVKISARKPENTETFLTVDGELARSLNKDDIIEISKETELFVKLIKMKNRSFYNVLSDKLKVSD